MTVRNPILPHNTTLPHKSKQEKPFPKTRHHRLSFLTTKSFFSFFFLLFLFLLLSLQKILCHLKEWIQLILKGFHFRFFSFCAVIMSQQASCGVISRAFQGVKKVISVHLKKHSAKPISGNEWVETFPPHLLQVTAYPTDFQ